jgi:hypothetical protein
MRRTGGGSRGCCGWTRRRSAASSTGSRRRPRRRRWESSSCAFSHFIPCGVWEAAYIIEGLLRNDSEVQPDTIHADTQGQSLPVFGLAALLGFDLLPRIRNWADLNFYRPSVDTRFEHIDSRRQRARLGPDRDALDRPAAHRDLDQRGSPVVGDAAAPAGQQLPQVWRFVDHVSDVALSLSPAGSVATAPLPAAVLVNCPVSGDCYSAFGGVGGAAEFLPGVEVVLDALAPGGDQA